MAQAPGRGPYAPHARSFPRLLILHLHPLCALSLSFPSPPSPLSPSFFLFLLLLSFMSFDRTRQKLPAVRYGCRRPRDPRAARRARCTHRELRGCVPPRRPAAARPPPAKCPRRAASTAFRARCKKKKKKKKQVQFRTPSGHGMSHHAPRGGGWR